LTGSALVSTCWQLSSGSRAASVARIHPQSATPARCANDHYLAAPETALERIAGHAAVLVFSLGLDSDSQTRSPTSP
jgi:hypothetical protein